MLAPGAAPAQALFHKPDWAGFASFPVAQGFLYAQLLSGGSLMKPPPNPGIKWRNAHQAARRIRRAEPFPGDTPHELLALAIELVRNAMAMIPPRRKKKRK